MTALSSFQIIAPGAAFLRAAAFSGRVAATAGEILLFFWTVLVLAFALLVMTGFFA
jgi:hypothetical protein